MSQSPDIFDHQNRSWSRPMNRMFLTAHRTACSAKYAKAAAGILRYLIGGCASGQVLLARTADLRH
jgi:hypothetical protein